MRSGTPERNGTPNGPPNGPPNGTDLFLGARNGTEGPENPPERNGTEQLFRNGTERPVPEQNGPFRNGTRNAEQNRTVNGEMTYLVV